MNWGETARTVAVVAGSGVVGAALLGACVCMSLGCNGGQLTGLPVALLFPSALVTAFAVEALTKAAWGIAGTDLALTCAVAAGIVQCPIYCLVLLRGRRRQRLGIYGTRLLLVHVCIFLGGLALLAGVRATSN